MPALSPSFQTWRTLLPTPRSSSGTDGERPTPLQWPPGWRDGAPAHADAKLDAVLSAQLMAWATDAGASLEAVIALAWGALLASLTAQDDVRVAWTHDGMRHALAFPADADDTVANGLRQQHAALADAAQHAVAWTSADFGAALHTGRATAPAGSPPARTVHLPQAAADADQPAPLALHATVHEGALSLRLVGNARQPLARWLDNLLAALRAMPAPGGQYLALRQLPLTGATESALLQRFNATDGPSPAWPLVHQWVEAVARQHPDATAVVMGERSLRYDELDARADALAARLQSLGVGPDVPVALYVGRSLDMVVAVLAVLKAGGAYVPLDPQHPPERTALVLEGAKPRVVLTQQALRDALPAMALAQTEVLVLDDTHHTRNTQEHNGEKSGTDRAPTGVPSAPNTDNLAYVIFTSGSTGTPKGVAMPHRALVNLLQWQAHHPELDAPQRTLQFAALGFDVAFQEIFATLGTGGTLVLLDEDTRRDPQALVRLMCAQRVQRLFMPFIGLQNIAEYLAAQPAEPLPPLQDVMTAGEQLHASPAIRALFRRLPGCRLHNQYGPTESHVVTALTLAEDPSGWEAQPTIGRPLDHCRIHVLDAQGREVPVGAVGELHIGGVQVARGYLHRSDLTRERFLPDPFAPAGAVPGVLYKTGDVARWREDGEIEYLGRNDHQVKIRGFRVELGDIESALLAHAAVRQAAVLARRDDGREARLVAYLSLHADAAGDGNAGAHPDTGALDAVRAHLRAALPPYMLPAQYLLLDTLPLSPNGKVERKALPAPAAQRPEMAQPYETPRDDAETRVCVAFAQALGIDRVGRADNFFDLGGDSLRVLAVLQTLQGDSQQRLSTNLFFRDPTPQAIARALAGQGETALQRRAASPSSDAADAQEPIAIVGMAGRFPGAADVDAFWANLCEGRDSIRFFEDAELDAGVSAALRADPAYVKARGVLDGVDQFDAGFFGILPREASLMDPQQRIFLEVCWECMERAGYAPDQQTRPVGVYAGMHNGTYFQRHVMPRPDLVEAVGEFNVMLGNEKDYVATRVAHKLNLRGPAISMNTACSTSLVAIGQAVQALRGGQCDMALAGGIAITCPPASGYLYQEGAMYSPDGHTRSFDAQAAGTVFSDGAAVVLLKRLSQAQADGDTIYALVRGVGLNNDGGVKASFTAPSVDGQAAAIAAALDAAGVDARSISYVEAHGTATPMGDPVEVEALAKAFARDTADTGFCALGSVKSNVGHLLMAAGGAGVIKTALALHEQKLPATLHFERANPAIDFEHSPFHVQDRLTPWPRSAQPRRAGVSSFGVGGTNAHVILEEAPVAEPTQALAGPQLITLSARSPAALTRSADALAAHLEARPALNLADVAHTLRVGRKDFPHRLAVVADGVAQAVAVLRDPASPWRLAAQRNARSPQPVFLFPGQGAQYAGMGRTLYVHDEAFRAALDACFDALRGQLPFDLRERMFSDDPKALLPTAVTQPATFALEYALASRALAMGLEPVAMIGHSVGEFAAAVIAGVMPLADAARLVARRGALMQALPPGAMLSVRMPAGVLLPRLGAELSLAAENGPGASVVAGPTEAIARLQVQLEAEGFAARPLQTSHAFHSRMMDAAVEPFAECLRRVPLSAPQRRIVSTLTGRELTAAEATDPAYWARHLREPVRFSPAVHEVAAALAQPVFIELGPRNTLCTLVRQHAGGMPAAPQAVATLGAEPHDELVSWLLALGRLWAWGAEPALGALDTRERQARVCLPTTPFERQRHWVDGAAAPATASLPAAAVTPASDATPEPGRSLQPGANNTQNASAAEPPMEFLMPAVPDRRANLQSKLRELFEDVSGVPMDQADGATAFVEQGLDSLVLTQAALQVKKHFQTPISFRQLMEGCRSFDLLAEHLDRTLPPDAAPAPAAQPMQAAAAQPVPASQPMAAEFPKLPALSALAAPVGDVSALQQLIAQQMQLMQQQLALLAGGAQAQALPSMPAAAATQPLITMPASTTNTANIAATAPASAAEEDKHSHGVSYDVKKAFGAIARIHTTPNREITPRQQARLDAFIRRYEGRTAKSKAFTAANRGHMADPRVVNGFRPATKEICYPLVVDRSKGSRVWDIDGNEYVDTLNGFGMNLFGWQPDFINEAVRNQLDQGYEIGPQHPLAAEVTRRICEMSGFDRAGLCNTGSEAVMAALRIARTTTGRSTVVLFSGSYHGTFDEVLVRAGRGARGIPATPGVMSGMFGDVRVLDYGTPESLQFIRENAHDLAAVLVEPVQSRRPDFQPKEFLQEVRAITEREGACLIFDEVITGFRSHPGGAQALFGVRADLATYGKVIGGGMPIGAVAGKREYMDALDGGAWNYGDDSIPTVGVTYFAGTFVRHPLALAAAKASLDHMAAAGASLQAQLNLHTAAMADELTAYCREVGAPLEVRYFASLWRVSWLEDHPLQDLLFAMMRSRGVHIQDNFPCFLTTAHTHQDIAAIKSAFKEAVAELQAAEFLPRRAPAAEDIVFDASHPPVPNARLGRDRDGQPAWFVPDPAAPGKFVKVSP